MTAFDDLSLLRAFVCIVECGSISAGARRLKIPQPTLSRYLRVLEERCGGTLLRRDTHRMSLTQTGQRFLADAQTMVAHAEEADQRLREDQTTLSGHLRLFATIDLGQSIVTRLVSSFLKINPKVTAELALSSRPLHMIQEGCDVGTLPGNITDEKRDRPARGKGHSLSCRFAFSGQKPSSGERSLGRCHGLAHVGHVARDERAGNCKNGPEQKKC
jgi:DNA-binding transcriptional LysR family regulator